MSKRKLEAWAVVSLGGIVIDVAANERWLLSAGKDERTAHLTEHSPTAERVLKAASRYFKRPSVGALLLAKDAVEAHLKATKRKR